MRPPAHRLSFLPHNRLLLHNRLPYNRLAAPNAERSVCGTAAPDRAPRLRPRPRAGALAATHDVRGGRLVHRGPSARTAFGPRGERAVLRRLPLEALRA